MNTIFKPLMQQLHELAGEIGELGEDDDSYARVYEKLSDALDIAEQENLITNEEEE